MNLRTYRSGIGIVLILLSLLSFVTPHSANAQTSIDGRFGEYWREHGGLPIFGHPISAQVSEPNLDSGKRHLTQWFERNRFELHNANSRPYDVLLGRLGADRLQQLGRDWKQFPQAAPSSRHYFAQTRHAIAHEPFWRYWSEHGLEFDNQPGTSYAESLALFGLPLSEPMMETNTSGDRVLTQWFERARFEDHGARGVLLGLLGNEVRGGTKPQLPTSLQYFWPRTSPLTVWSNGSYADDRSFVLHLTWPHATAPDATISGGAIAAPPEGPSTPVNVRGQRGRLHTVGAKLMLSWTEKDQFYLIYGSLRQSEMVELANDLEVLNLAAFQARLEAASAPTRDLQYFWPNAEEHELSVLPEPHGGSFARETSFKLNLYRVHSRQPDVTISGGDAVQAPRGTGRTVTVRGQQATAYTTSRGAALVWTERGHKYMVDGDFSFPDLLDWTSTLQVIDLQTFRLRIQPE